MKTITNLEGLYSNTYRFKDNNQVPKGIVETEGLRIEANSMPIPDKVLVKQPNHICMYWVNFNILEKE